MNTNTIIQLTDAAIYQQSLLILNEVNLTLNKGEFAYLIGKTGSGKTSLLKTIYGELPLQKGKGVVANFNLKQLNRKTIPLLRRKLGIIFQDFNLLQDRDIGQNLQFVLQATGWKDQQKINSRINEVLSQVKLNNAKTEMPHELSGGEQQRVVIARALLNHPALIIADEPTGNLDPETSDDILLLLRELALGQNTAVILATHDYRILENFPARIIRCQNGHIEDEENILL